MISILLNFSWTNSNSLNQLINHASFRCLETASLHSSFYLHFLSLPAVATEQLMWRDGRVMEGKVRRRKVMESLVHCGRVFFMCGEIRVKEMVFGAYGRKAVVMVVIGRQECAWWR